MTCPSAERLCSIPEAGGPPRPLDTSSSELPPSSPGRKLGRLLSPTYTHHTQMKNGLHIYTLLSVLFTSGCELTSCLEVLGNSSWVLEVLFLEVLVLKVCVLAASSSSSVSSSLAGHESIPVAASRTSGIWKSSWRKHRGDGAHKVFWLRLN